MSLPAGSHAPAEAEIAGPPRAGGRRRTTLTAVAFLAAAAAAGAALWSGTDDHTAHAAVPLRPAATTAHPDPGTLIVSRRAIDLGRTGVQVDIDLGNTGDQPLQYQVSTRTKWLRLTTIGGSLAPTGSARVILLVDRTAVPAGRSVGTVLVSWDGGSQRITVSLEQPAH